MTAGPRAAVVVASAGRPAVLTYVLEHILTRVDGVDLLVVCVPDAASRPEQQDDDRLIVIDGPRGASAQRNHAVAHLPPSVEFVFFFDDDCLPDRDYIISGIRRFDDARSTAGITGLVLYDGAAEGAIQPREGSARLASGPPRTTTATEVYGLYGCNFAVRRAAVRREWFDERLPLYSWLEDEDLSRRIRRVGRLEMWTGCRCVHLGSPTGGRTSHLRFGYSQVMNAVYLRRKGSITARRLVRLLLVALGGNLRGLPSSEWTSRLLRLRGNALAAADVLRGRILPERILSLGSRPS